MELMDAGVTMKATVAGNDKSLVKDDNGYANLTDILGDEDHLGDMDFKVAGTTSGITALQMDIKSQGITEAIMEQAMEQAVHARLHMLGSMNKVPAQSRDTCSENSSRFEPIKGHPCKIPD